MITKSENKPKFSIIAVLDKVENDLNQIIFSKSLEGNYFTLKEINECMIEIIVSLNSIYKNGEFHGCMESNNIYYSYGKYKLSDGKHFGKIPLYFQVLANNEKVSKSIYLSPQLIQVCKFSLI